VLCVCACVSRARARACACACMATYCIIQGKVIVTNIAAVKKIIALISLCRKNGVKVSINKLTP
jgi:UDP-N-acetylglucosamine enolpyruvyl transferase